MMRVNQVAYPAACPKHAFAMLTRAQGPLAFQVRDAHSGRVVFRGVSPAPGGGFNARWPAVYPLRFDQVKRDGSYVVTAGALRSPVFRIGPALGPYRGIAAKAIAFLQAQRDGPHVIPGPLHRAASHLHDQSATVYETPRYNGTTLASPLRPTAIHRDVSGGWFDAGDYLKFVETTSFDDVLLLFALREYPRSLPQEAARAEARFATDWLMRMWDPARRVLYYQVGIGDGNGRSVLGDHDLWRLPQADDRLRVRPGSPLYYVSYRPVFAANAPGAPISPNLAGRVAAAFALCAQDFAATDPGYARRCLRAGQEVYDQANTAPRGPLTTTSPHAYYDEIEWRDDMELGGAELYLATKLLGGAGMPHSDPFHYLAPAGHWADAYASSRTNGLDSLNLYDVAGLGHYDLAKILRSKEYVAFGKRMGRRADLPTNPGALVRDLTDNVKLSSDLTTRDPFGLAYVVDRLDTVPHVLGTAIQAHLVDALTGRPSFEGLAQSQLDWVLGANPWGTSFIAGAGTTFPHCLAHEVANLSGSLDGRPPTMSGATVDGPALVSDLTGLGAPSGYRPCPPDGRDPLAAIRTRTIGYLDDVRSSTTSEPSNDYAMLALLAAAQQAQR